MELRDIEYFAIVAEQKHFGRAADILGLSQPALSKSLKRLEQSLQLKLLARTPKGVELTPEGSALLRRVHDVRLAFQSLARELTDVNQGFVGYLRIGAGAAMSEQFLSAAFTALLANAPRTRLKVVVSDNDLMIPALHNGELDLVVNYIPHDVPDGMVFDHLYDDPQLVCASTKHRLAGKSNLTLSDLQQERWALNEPNVEANLWLQACFQARGLRPPRTTFESRSAALRIRTVAASDLLAFVPHSAIRLAEASGLKVAPLAVEELKRSRRIGAGFRREIYLPPVLGRFIEILKTSAKDAVS